MLFYRLKRGYRAFHDATSPGARVFAGFVGLVLLVMALAFVVGHLADYASNHEREREQPAQAAAAAAFICNTSTNGKPIMSFDSGRTWAWDDGRCAWKLQAKRDEDAQIYSYWPTTLRVDADMDSFWLKGEERTCQTYPDAKGRVAIVACNLTGSHRDHNIPVKFWGGVDRHVISGWKCRREGDDFVCRAID